MTRNVGQYQLAMHRNSERGAALFVVVMVITLLTAVGIFAARSTGLVDAAIGYGRQAAQTTALADLGAKLVASELGQGRAQRVFQLMDPSQKQYCPTYANPNLTSTLSLTGLQPCYAFDYSQLEARVYQNTGNFFNVIEYQDTGVDGSLGPRFADSSITSGVDGVLVVELFDPFETANIRGQSASQASGREVTLNAIAQIRSFSALAERSQTNPQWCGTNSASTSASVLSIRSQVLVPVL
jgi:hypothetical protein